ncbi:MAG: T9SS type A sorting domain-containing protein [Flavobacteriales bacterium]|nr:T9SS type A sorting domain-containing protein [Flavobacteriales bacterium]MCB9168214.1 T9SS type A sorting domain-containing protein [Flavobacteriales bacterium]
MKRSLLLLPFVIPGLAHAQLTITDSLSVPDLATLLEGLNVSIVNVQVNCAPGSHGEFNGVSEIPITHGLVLSTGLVDSVAGPNTNGGTSTFMGTPGDTDLGALVQLQTYDACVLEFDCIPYGDTLLFNFAFGSEEYQEFVNSGFNDVFAIWITGAGFPVPTNVATIPGGTPVSINNVNGTTNSSYFVDNENPPGQQCTLDGFTQNLTAFAVVTPGATYHFKVAVADVSDGIFDSAVMLEAFSFRSVMGISTGISATTDAGLLAAMQGDRLVLQLQRGTPSTDLRIIDALGQEVRRSTLDGTRTEVDLSGLPDGCYIAEARNAGRVWTARFVK